MESESGFLAVQQELAALLEALESGNVEFIDLDELDAALEAVIQRYENDKYQKPAPPSSFFY